MSIAQFQREVIEKAQALVRKKSASKRYPVRDQHNGTWVFPKGWTYAERALAIAVFDMQDEYERAR